MVAIQSLGYPHNSPQSITRARAAWGFVPRSAALVKHPLRAWNLQKTLTMQKNCKIKIEKSAFWGTCRANPVIKPTSIEREDPISLINLQSEWIFLSSLQSYCSFNFFHFSSKIFNLNKVMRNADFPDKKEFFLISGRFLPSILESCDGAHSHKRQNHHAFSKSAEFIQTCSKIEEPTTWKLRCAAGPRIKSKSILIVEQITLSLYTMELHFLHWREWF